MPGRTAAAAPPDADIVLRDGSTLRVRPFAHEDVAAVHALYEHLSSDSRRNRFGGGRVPDREEVERLCSNAPTDTYALVAERGDHLVAIVQYYVNKARPNRAEVALAVADDFQGRGVGTRMLEQLAMVAREHGVASFDAQVLSTNDRMLQAFEDSGFSIQETTDTGDTLVRLSLEDTPAREDASLTRAGHAAVASMRAFFEPESVAVIGANRERGKIGSEILHNLVSGGFRGRVCAVNPRLATTPALPAYASVREVPFDIDLAVIAVSAAHVAAAVDDCIAKGVRALVVISAGFGETDEAGRAREAALVAKVRAAGIRMIGPNCMGLLNTNPVVRLNVTFAPGRPPEGRVAFSSQSGALGLAILDYVRYLNLGISTFVSVGNKADVSGNDLIQYWAEDPHTDVILLYLESFGNPRKFGQIARRIARRKPIVAVKAGRSPAGARAASSHTGALAATDSVVDALFRQSGVIRTDTLEELFDVATLLGHQPLPAGPRVAILTNAGGPGILAADACEARGLTLPQLADSTSTALRAFLPAAASVSNPVDMLATASADDYARAIPLLLADSAIDSLLVIFTPPLVTDITDAATAVANAAQQSRKPVLATFMTASGMPPVLAPIPCYRFPESAARALARVHTYAAWRRAPIGARVSFGDTRPEAARAVIDKALASGQEWLTPLDATAVLSAFGIPVIPTAAAASEDAATAEAARLGFPVALKASGPSIVHKTEVEGVALDLRSDAAVRAAHRDMAARFGSAMTYALLQPMAAGGVEMIVGAALDPSLGHVVLCGSGGTLAEVMRDTACRLHPLTDLDAAALVNETRGAVLLRGFRGAPPADEGALRQTLLRVSALLDACPEILEMDLNPVIVRPDGVCIVDARIRVGTVAPPQPSRRVAY